MDVQEEVDRVRLDGAKADEFLESLVKNRNIELEAHGKRFLLQLLDVKNEEELDADENNQAFAKRLLELNPEVKKAVKQSREEYVRGEYYTTDDFINDIERGEL